jgi:serine/threonine protein kinase
MAFQQLPTDEGAIVYLEETDRELPQKVDSRTRYAYFKTIARGGKSIIQSCKDLHLSRVICYKSIRKELSSNPTEQLRFLREARVTAMLQHPSTVPVYELGRETSGNLYFTMKLVHGYTLRQILDYRDRYDLNQLMDVVVRVGHALDSAHTHGVVHRDIKPENILVGPFGEVLVLDWGLAKVWKRDGSTSEPPSDNMPRIVGDDLSMTGKGQLEGTVAYMSPEQIRKDPNIDHRTDIYSLATIIYEILAGQLLARGETVDELIDSVLNQQPIKPEEVAKYNVPPLLQKICLHCLKKDPAQRPQNMGDLVSTLQQDWLR